MKAAAAMSYPLSVIKMALPVCFALRIPVAIWGPPGSGKTQMAQQLARELEAKMYTLNLATMEPTDVGGHPYPIQRGDRTLLSWIHSDDAIPFVTPEREDELSILFADEFDRCPQQTQNPFMNLMWEREINGRKLCPSTMIVCAGNGTTDSGTTPITEAMATRCVHLYVNSSTPQALEGWDGWAQRQGVDPWMRAFARYRQNLIVGKDPTYTEIQRPNQRTAYNAYLITQFCKTVPWGREVLEPLVYGAVGQLSGREMIAFWKMSDAAPTAQEIVANPLTTPVPLDVGVLWALGRYLIDAAGNGGAGEKVKYTEAFATYALRWPEEARADWMRTASTKLPSLVGTKQFREWESHFVAA